MSDIFESQIVAFARKIDQIKAHCTSEEAVKIYLVLPFLALLGYDASDPRAVIPERSVEGRSGTRHTVDFAVAQDRIAQIAIEVFDATGSLAAAQDRLQAYFDSASETRLAIATNGLSYHCYIDSDLPGSMDAEPFLTLDLEAVASGAVDPDVFRLLKAIRSRDYQPETLVEQAFTTLLHQRLKTLLMQEFRRPSDDFCRDLLGQIGLRHVTPAQIDGHYRAMVKSAMEHAIVLPVLEALRDRPASAAVEDHIADIDTRIVSSSHGLTLLDYVRERLATVAETDEDRALIEGLTARDYVGRLAICLDARNPASLVDYIAMGDGRHRVVFPDLGLDIVASTLEDIDQPLIAVFRRRSRGLKAVA